MLIIAIVVLSAYANTLLNGFVYDDRQQVLQNPWITNIRYLPNILFSSVWAFEGDHGGSNYYRPVMHLIYMAEYHLFGLKAWGWHLVNIIIHTLNSTMVFLIASTFFRLSTENNQEQETSREALSIVDQYTIRNSPISAFIAALLFAMHPINTEPVAWIAGIPELSFTFFYLLSFYLYRRSHDGNGR